MWGGSHRHIRGRLGGFWRLLWGFYCRDALGERCDNAPVLSVAFVGLLQLFPQIIHPGPHLGYKRCRIRVRRVGRQFCVQQDEQSPTNPFGFECVALYPHPDGILTDAQHFGGFGNR